MEIDAEKLLKSLYDAGWIIVPPEQAKIVRAELQSIIDRTKPITLLDVPVVKSISKWRWPWQKK